MEYNANLKCKNIYDMNSYNYNFEMYFSFLKLSLVHFDACQENYSLFKILRVKVEMENFITLINFICKISTT